MQLQHTLMQKLAVAVDEYIYRVHSQTKGINPRGPHVSRHHQITHSDGRQILILMHIYILKRRSARSSNPHLKISIANVRRTFLKKLRL